MGIPEEPEVVPGVEDLSNEAADAKEGLVLATRKLPEGQVQVLESHPIIME
jgi:hypothetical protein